MYRITKVLNHNTVLAVKDKSAREYLIVGKGVGSIMQSMSLDI